MKSYTLNLEDHDRLIKRLKRIKGKIGQLHDCTITGIRDIAWGAVIDLEQLIQDCHSAYLEGLDSQKESYIFRSPLELATFINTLNFSEEEKERMMNKGLMHHRMHNEYKIYVEKEE